MAFDAELIELGTPVALRRNCADADDGLFLVMIQSLNIVRIERGQRGIEQHYIRIQRDGVVYHACTVRNPSHNLNPVGIAGAEYRAQLFHIAPLAQRWK